jgi:hypothetical protein
MRHYGKWAGNPEGIKEDVKCCVAEISSDFHFVQCSRKRGKGPGGLYCGIHANMIKRNKYVYVPDNEGELK